MSASLNDGYGGAYVIDPSQVMHGAPIATLDFLSLYPGLVTDSKPNIDEKDVLEEKSCVKDGKVKMLSAFDWRSIDVDDYVCDWEGYMLRVEQMDKHYWWWCVSDDKNDVLFHDSDMTKNGFPMAKTWQDACYFATLVAKHIAKSGPNVPLYYLTHALPKRNRRLRRIRGPRFAYSIFPPVEK